MIESLFQEFAPASREVWIEALKKELKGQDFEAQFHKNDPIEGISYPSYFHREDAASNPGIPGKYPYLRGNQQRGNDWEIASEIIVTNEKDANQTALNYLNSGTNALIFDLTQQQTPHLELLLAGIGLEYIQVGFRIKDQKQMQPISDFLQGKKYREILFYYNPLAQDQSVNEAWMPTVRFEGLVRFFEVDAAQIQQAGANAAQEIAFALSLGHEYLIRQTEQGISVDDALVAIHFNLGVGANYLLEIAKFRVFRELWARIARSYQPQHACNELASVTVSTGFMNKSLRDPYTNLLRQTTEAMSAVIGGTERLLVQPYDRQASNGASAFAHRMATNISLLLKEESYLHWVQDPAGGSYAIEKLSLSLADKAWHSFQQMEAEGGISGNNWREAIRATAQQRINAVAEGKQVLIGINKFPDPNPSNAVWQNTGASYFGLKPLILENELEAQQRTI